MVLKIYRILDPDQRKSAIALLVLMLIGMLLETLGVGLVVPALTLMMQDDSMQRSAVLSAVVERLGTPSQETLILISVGFLLVVYAAKNLFLAFLAWRQARFAFQAQARMSNKLFARYLGQPYVFHLQHNSAQLIRNVTTECTLFASHALLPGMLVIAEAFVLCGIGVLLFSVEPVGALIVIAVVGGTSWLFYRLTRTRSVRWGKTRQLHEGMRLQQIQQGLGGVKDVKMLGCEADFLTRFERHNVENARVGARQSALQQMPRLWLELLAVGGLAILVFSLIAQDRSLESIVPTLGLFAAAAFRLMPSMNRVLTSLQGLRYGMPVIDLLFSELTATVPPPIKGDAASSSLQFQKEVRLREVTYTYPGANAPALDSLSLNVQKGQTVGIVGSSGAGKSTLVDILLGLLTPSAGTVEVDGVAITADARDWRRQIGYVPQSIYLTDDSLRRNVAFGVPDENIDDDAVAQAIAFAQLEDFVATLPERLDTLVGERGVRLSGGQRQRIGIARALYHNPPILVLDEATSALDVATEREVMKAIENLHGAKTIIIVAHRFSTVEHCDRLYRLEQGKILDEGPPARLLDGMRSLATGELPVTE